MYLLYTCTSTKASPFLKLMFLPCAVLSAVFLYEIYPVYPEVIILCNYETRNPFLKKTPSTLTTATEEPNTV
jgi:ABC-type polysaccharide transport system permease subunit